MVRLRGGCRLRGMEKDLSLMKLVVQKSWEEGGKSARWRWSPFILSGKKRLQLRDFVDVRKRPAWG